MTIRICGLALAAFAAWVLGVASAQESAAEPGLTLGQFLEDTARNHPRLEEARAELDAAEARGRANSRPLYNPEFEGEFSDSEDDADDSRSIGLSKAFDIINKRATRAKGARSAVELARRKNAFARSLKRPAQAPDRNMRVIAFTDALGAVGPLQVIALSRGSEDGVDNGTTYSVYTEGETVQDDTDYPEGKSRAFFHPKASKVTLPPEFIGHVMVFRTFKRVSYALVMDAVRPVQLGDFMHDPDSTP